MSRIFISFLFIFISCYKPGAHSQEIKGKATATLLFGKKLFLWETIGNQPALIDSTIISDDGEFTFPVKKFPTGYYLLSVSDSSRADLILSNYESIVEIEFHNPLLQEGIKIVRSEENKLLWEYKLISKAIYQDLKKIYIEKSFIPLPPSTAGDSALLNHFLYIEDSLNKHKAEELKRITDKGPGTYFARSAKASLRNQYLNREEQKNHFFEPVDFSDATLIRSNVFPMNMMDYLQRYTEYTEDGFKSSIDTILTRARANEEVFEYCLNFLLELFDRVGPDVIFQYLAEKYLIGEGCSSNNLKGSYNGKAERYRLTLPGNKAPDLSVPGINSKEINIGEFAADHKVTLLFFWSSHCAFCHEAMPVMKQIFETYSSEKLGIIAISLDEKSEDWEKYINVNNLKWVNVCDFKGWKSEAVAQYNIHKTPSWYLIDPEKKIISKPGNTEELNKDLAKYF